MESTWKNINSQYFYGCRTFGNTAGASGGAISGAYENWKGKYGKIRL